ncbi:hypothetical protein, partial [Serratia marcescens]|uniref:hypothetical protein n=1 Tax=Serratia marcescens TaxID=615 RepID=UPI001C12A229
QFGLSSLKVIYYSEQLFRADRIEGTLTTAHKGNGIHGNAYKQYVYDKLINSQTDKEFLSSLKQIKSELEGGKVFPLANGRIPTL